MMGPIIFLHSPMMGPIIFLHTPMMGPIIFLRSPMMGPIIFLHSFVMGPNIFLHTQSAFTRQYTAINLKKVSVCSGNTVKQCRKNIGTPQTARH